MSLVSAEDIIVSQSNVLWQKSVINNGLFWIVLTHYQLWGRVWEFIWTFFVVFVQYLLEPSLFKLCIFPSCTWQFYLHTWSWIMQDNILPKVMNPPSTHWGFWDFPPVASIFLLHCVHYWLSANATLWLCSVCLSLLLLGVVCPTWNTRHTWIQTIGKKKMKKKKNKPEYSPRQKWTNNPQTWFVILFRGHQVRFIVQRWGNDDPSWAAAVEMDANGHLMESKKLHWYMYEISRAGNNPPPPYFFVQTWRQKPFKALTGRLVHYSLFRSGLHKFDAELLRETGHLVDCSDLTPQVLRAFSRLSVTCSSNMSICVYSYSF